MRLVLAEVHPEPEVERWTHDHGPRRLTEVIVLEDGRVVDVRRGGYGYAE